MADYETVHVYVGHPTLRDTHRRCCSSFFQNTQHPVPHIVRIVIVPLSFRTPNTQSHTSYIVPLSFRTPNTQSHTSSLFHSFFQNSQQSAEATHRSCGSSFFQYTQHSESHIVVIVPLSFRTPNTQRHTSLLLFLFLSEHPTTLRATDRSHCSSFFQNTQHSETHIVAVVPLSFRTPNTQNHTS